jgi:hypothetical protein
MGLRRPSSPPSRERPVIRPILVLATLAAGIPALAAPALAQGTPEQRAACTPDALRLCGAEIPDVGRITACLKRERARLSASCRHAMGGAMPGAPDVTATGSLAKRGERRD